MEFWRIADDKIKKAYEEGEFDNLPGFGKPLELDDDSGIPKNLRMAYRILKNAGYKSEEDNEIRKEIMTIEDLIKSSTNEEERELLVKDLNKKLLQYNALLSKRRIKTNSTVFKNYQNKIENRLL
ncbi:DUF1992 domain-containing protein [Caldibacillus thermolactis]|uniref:DUF1992 domain-containing protein n=1 Tax=Pallidibacillus thermolactis TaxID=251051 RepID=A0ABT2WFS3_9BACI|nr:DnaJ family domain-containing protein [Pallidibacillus thermolactis]MCU9594525.1 DUF1992 domain-containing protein [Pallidibacillus thermolactis]MCU9601908.1 DUF1992 domain-containing protein [Pallidibacillus thermolactis subsp. kokeshiiformis]